MNVLMYPIAPDDDFPDEFCAIRQGSGEHWFYTPVGEDASWMLFRANAENEKLRELVRHMHTCMEHYEMDGTISCDRCPLNNCVGNCDYERRMRELGVEVDE